MLGARMVALEQGCASEDEMELEGDEDGCEDGWTDGDEEQLPGPSKVRAKPIILFVNLWDCLVASDQVCDATSQVLCVSVI